MRTEKILLSHSIASVRPFSVKEWHRCGFIDHQKDIFTVLLPQYRRHRVHIFSRHWQIVEVRQEYADSFGQYCGTIGADIKTC